MSTALTDTEIRRSKIEELLLNGVSSLPKLAARFGVPTTTIVNDVAVIRRLWRLDNSKNARDRRTLRIKQLEEIFQKSMDSFERSRSDTVETTTQYKSETCAACRGRKLVGDEFCSACDGEGKIQVEVITQKIVGKAGDVAFLNSARASIADIAKIEGIVIKPQPIVQHNTFNGENTIVNTKGNPYLDAPSDILHTALSAIHALKQSVKPNAAETLEGTIVSDNDRVDNA
jgi:hypothetical protein